MSLIEEARAVRQRIAARLQELEPLAREYEELRLAAAELGIDAAEELAVALGSEPERQPRSDATQPAPAKRRSTRRRAGAQRETRAASAAPPDNGDELGQRVLQAVREQPGQTVADYALTLGVSATVLYRPVRELTTSGQLVKRNRQLYPS